MKIVVKKRILIFTLLACTACMITPPVQANFFSRVGKLFNVNNLFKKKKKNKEKENLQESTPSEGLQAEVAVNAQPQQLVTTPIVAAQQTPRPQRRTTININDVVATVQSVAVEGPEIYTLLVNDSITRLLEKTEDYISKLRWGSRKKLANELSERVMFQRQKASTLLQVEIWREYLDSQMPLKNFMQDLTREEEKLKEYQLAIAQLFQNEWLRSNENLNKRVEHILLTIDDTRKTLEQLDSFYIQLVDVRHDGTPPPIYRMIYMNPNECKQDDEFDTLIRKSLNDCIDGIVDCEIEKSHMNKTAPAA